MVIGADGVNSFVARAVRAPEYDVRPVAACGYYSYFSGVRQDDIELYVRDHHAFGGAPTNDGLHLVMVNWPAKTFRPCAPTLRGTSGGRSSPRPTSLLACARAVARKSGTARQACPATSASRMAKDGRSSATRATTEIRLRRRASATHSSRPRCSRRRSARCCRARDTFEDRRAAHEAARNERVRPMYEFTNQLAALEPPPPEMRALFGALHGNQDATNAFLSAITGAIPLPDFMSNENLGRIMAAAKDVEFHR